MADQLTLISVDGAIVLTALPWGTVAPGSSADQTFRVRNDSDLYTATEVLVSLTGTGSVDHYLSTDEVVYTATAELGDLAPSGVSDTITLRRVTPTGASTGAGTCTLRLQAAAWTTEET